MAFTYDLTSPIGMVRLEIGDTAEGAGVKPDGDNLTDAEIQYCINGEGTDPGLVKRATAAACEILARSWSNVASITLGPRREEFSGVADQWAKRAADLRDRYGSAADGQVGTISTTGRRIDGFSNAAAGGDL